MLGAQTRPQRPRARTTLMEITLECSAIALALIISLVHNTKTRRLEEVFQRHVSYMLSSLNKQLNI